MSSAQASAATLDAQEISMATESLEVVRYSTSSDTMESERQKAMRLLDLPNEILQNTARYLTQGEILQTMKTCWRLHDIGKRQLYHSPEVMVWMLKGFLAGLTSSECPARRVKNLVLLSTERKRSRVHHSLINEDFGVLTLVPNLETLVLPVDYEPRYDCQGVANWLEPPAAHLEFLKSGCFLSRLHTCRLKLDYTKNSLKEFERLCGVIQPQMPIPRIVLILIELPNLANLYVEEYDNAEHCGIEYPDEYLIGNNNLSPIWPPLRKLHFVNIDIEPKWLEGILSRRHVVAFGLLHTAESHLVPRHLDQSIVKALQPTARELESLAITLPHERLAGEIAVDSFEDLRKTCMDAASENFGLVMIDVDEEYHRTGFSEVEVWYLELGPNTQTLDRLCEIIRLVSFRSFHDRSSTWRLVNCDFTSSYPRLINLGSSLEDFGKRAGIEVSSRVDESYWATTVFDDQDEWRRPY